MLDAAMSEIWIPLGIITISLFLAFRRLRDNSRGMGYAWLFCALLNALYLVRILAWNGGTAAN